MSTFNNVQVGLKETVAGSSLIVFALSACHFVNDAIQSNLLALYPVLQAELRLSFTEIGGISMIYQILASALQPLMGHVTDRHKGAHTLVAGMCITATGVLVTAFATNYWELLVGAAITGIGSSAFHPESSRIARLACGQRKGLSQSIYQVGGNLGTACAPLFAAYVILLHGRASMLWLAVLAIVAALALIPIATWANGMRDQEVARRAFVEERVSRESKRADRKPVVFTLCLLIFIVVVKYAYLASLNAYYTFFLIKKFNLSIADAQIHLTYFLLSIGVGTLIGGFVGDKTGRRRLILVSMVGTAPFALLLPTANLFWTSILTTLVALTIASTFSSIVVYAQDLLPQRVGLVSGLFFGLAAGIAGLASAGLGMVADSQGLLAVYRYCSFLPLLGFVAFFLPMDAKQRPSNS